tara:strand:- start:460 stop:687 length:228 start_codon:yes stop_codon:yes gene_type:complete
MSKPEWLLHKSPAESNNADAERQAILEYLDQNRLTVLYNFYYLAPETKPLIHFSRSRLSKTMHEICEVVFGRRSP